MTRIVSTNPYSIQNFDSPRLVIDTHAHFDQFKRGEIGQNHEAINIEGTAAPHVLYEAKFFFNATAHHSILLRDELGNTIRLMPRDESVFASFRDGKHLARHLPTTYKHYDISYNYRAILTTADLAHIAGFVYAETLTLGNRLDVKGDLANQIAGMKQLKNLHTLRVDINPETSTSQVKAFLEIPPAVTMVIIDLPETMNWEQAAEFAEGQEVPDEWELNYANHVITFVKVRQSSQNHEEQMLQGNAHLFEWSKQFWSFWMNDVSIDDDFLIDDDFRQIWIKFAEAMNFEWASTEFLGSFSDFCFKWWDLGFISSIFHRIRSFSILFRLFPSKSLATSVISTAVCLFLRYLKAFFCASRKSGINRIAESLGSAELVVVHLLVESL